MLGSFIKGLKAGATFVLLGTVRSAKKGLMASLEGMFKFKG
jgi:hypothetical protein